MPDTLLIAYAGDCLLHFLNSTDSYVLRDAVIPGAITTAARCGWNGSSSAGTRSSCPDRQDWRPPRPFISATDALGAPPHGDMIAAD
jgi:hypothetical protein